MIISPALQNVLDNYKEQMKPILTVSKNNLFWISYDGQGSWSPKEVSFDEETVLQMLEDNTLYISDEKYVLPMLTSDEKVMYAQFYKIKPTAP